MGVKVAVLDTDPLYLEAMGCVLEGRYEVTTHLLGEVALDEPALREFLTRENPHFVIYDISPPYRENLQLFERLRKEAGMSCQFIMTTTSRALCQEYQPEGNVLQVLKKPFELERLFHIEAVI